MKKYKFGFVSPPKGGENEDNKDSDDQGVYRGSGKCPARR